MRETRTTLSNNNKASNKQEGLRGNDGSKKQVGRGTKVSVAVTVLHGSVTVPTALLTPDGVLVLEAWTGVPVMH